MIEGENEIELIFHNDHSSHFGGSFQAEITETNIFVLYENFKNKYPINYQFSSVLERSNRIT